MWKNKVELEKKETEILLHQLLDMGEMLLHSGAETNRVEKTLEYMSKAYGATKASVFIITSGIIMTVGFPVGREMTQMRRISGVGSTDFTKLEKLNALSRRCSVEPIPVRELEKELELLKEDTDCILVCVGSILSAGCFTIFFGGTIWDGIATAFTAIVVFWLQGSLPSICPNKVIYYLVSSFLTGLSICLLAGVAPFLHADKIMIGDIMLLIPGIAMTNAVRDILVGDTISGAVRLIESFVWAGALACGFMPAIWLLRG